MKLNHFKLISSHFCDAMVKVSIFYPYFWRHPEDASCTRHSSKSKAVISLSWLKRFEPHATSARTLRPRHVVLSFSQARQLVIRVINCKPVNLCTTVQLVFETFGIILTLWQTYRMLRGLGQCRALGQLSGELQFWAGKMLLSLQFVLARREATSRSFNLMVQPSEADTLESPPWRVFAYFCFDFLTCFVSSS